MLSTVTANNPTVKCTSTPVGATRCWCDGSSHPSGVL